MRLNSFTPSSVTPKTEVEERTLRRARPNFGAAVVWCRLQMTGDGTSRREVAERAGITTRHLGKIEKGRIQPTRKETIAIARALQLPYRSLLSIAAEWEP